MKLDITQLSIGSWLLSSSQFQFSNGGRLKFLPGGDGYWGNNFLETMWVLSVQDLASWVHYEFHFLYFVLFVTVQFNLKIFLHKLWEKKSSMHFTFEPVSPLHHIMMRSHCPPETGRQLWLNQAWRVYSQNKEERKRVLNSKYYFYYRQRHLLPETQIQLLWEHGKHIKGWMDTPNIWHYRAPHPRHL